MVKRLFALAGVSALAGVVSAAASAGCSSADTAMTDGDSGASTPDGGKSKPPVPGDDAEPGGSPPECTPTKTIDVSGVPYTTALAAEGACTGDEAKAIQEFLDDAIAAGKTAFKQSEWAATVSAGCASCVFTAEDAPKWGPILNDAKDAEVFGGYNFGACVEIESGKEACGRAYHQFLLCQLQACTSKNCKDDEISDCLQDPKLQEEICKAAVDALATECGPNVNTYVKACPLGIEDRIKTQCVSPKSTTPPQDAGDGGT